MHQRKSRGVSVYDWLLVCKLRCAGTSERVAVLAKFSTKLVQFVVCQTHFAISIRKPSASQSSPTRTWLCSHAQSLIWRRWLKSMPWRRPTPFHRAVVPGTCDTRERGPSPRGRWYRRVARWFAINVSLGWRGSDSSRRKTATKAVSCAKTRSRSVATSANRSPTRRVSKHRGKL